MVQERDIFVKYFQKPTQIYKYIAKRPCVFLYRNVSYLRHRMSRSHKSRHNAKIDTLARQLLANNSSNNNYNPNTRKSRISSSETIDVEKEQNEMVSYNFICNKKTAQLTRCSGFVCPWCHLNAKFLYSLLNHLRYCHMRFKFNCVETEEGCRIDITLNELYDGSYCGFKYPGHDLRHDFRFTPRFGPRARIPFTQILYFKSKKNKTMYRAKLSNNDHLDEKMKIANTFQFDDGEADIDVCSGRLYYHTSTCLPVKPNEVDCDSEADNDPAWLLERTQLMIDEFTDVNEGEKEILKLWNLHIMQNYKYKADSLIRQACLDFAEKFGQVIIEKNLYRNFTLHLANIYDYGLISSSDLLECVRIIKKIKQPVILSSKQAKSKIELNGNDLNGSHSPAKRALLSSQCN